MEQIEDAEVISEGAKPPPPPPRAAELKPADAFGVFDGGVDDAPNAKKKPAEGAEAARAKAKGRAKKPQPAPQPPVDPAIAEAERQRKARRTAEKMVDTFFAFQLNLVRERYSSMLTPESMEDLIRRIQPSPAEREGWVEPLTEGCLENGITLPWWASLGIQAFISIAARKALLEQLELKLQQTKDADAAAAKAAAADAKK